MGKKEDISNSDNLHAQSIIQKILQNPANAVNILNNDLGLDLNTTTNNNNNSNAGSNILPPDFAQNFAGMQGMPGMQGIPGMQGMKGMQNIQGMQGMQNIPGMQGMQGMQNIPGMQGMQGMQNIPGMQGMQNMFGAQNTQSTSNLGDSISNMVNEVMAEAMINNMGMNNLNNNGNSNGNSNLINANSSSNSGNSGIKITDIPTNNLQKANDVVHIKKLPEKVRYHAENIMDFMALFSAQTITNEQGKKEKIFTHTSMGYPAGSYNVPPEEMPTVYELLEKAISKKKKVHLTEKPTNPSCLKVDLDFRFSLTDLKRKYGREHVKGMVKLYSETILEYVDIDPKIVKAYVFERPGPYKFKGNEKDGIHIMYPDVMIDTTLQMMIRDVVVEKCSKILENLPLKNSFTDVVDLSVIARNNWLMYGCCKPGLPPYDLTHVFNSDLTEEKDLSIYTTSFLIRHLSNFNRTKPIFYIKDDTEKQALYESKLRSQTEKDQKKKKTMKPELMRNYILTKRRRAKCSDSTITEVKKLVALLQPYRAENYQDWIEVGWCLHNIDESLLETWVKFSKKSEKYMEGECEQLWVTFRDEGLGLGSLHRWSKLDDSDGYSEVLRENISSYILKSVTCTTYDVARVVFELYKYQYKCVNVKHNRWYEFKNHKWCESDCAIGLKKKISNDVLNEYLHLVGYYNSNAIVQQDENKDQFLVKSKALTDVTYKLRDYTFKEKVLKECVQFFYDEAFFVRLDSDPYLICFENGVYDLKKAEFRDGRPEDYISISTGNDYMEFDHDDEIITEIYTFMSQIFTHSSVREYVFMLFASFLLGQNIEQKFHIFNGLGGNGKSMLIDLFELSFGEYCCKFPITLLTQKRPASGSANPELERARAARVVTMQEPDENERLNIGFMKELTGGDKIMVRGLYKEPIEYKPKFKMILCCNHLPKVPPNDEGTWRRLRVIEFLSKFTDNPDPNNPYEFKKDISLGDKLFIWKEAFMYLLLQYFKKYRKDGLSDDKTPDEVLKATREYQKTCDIYIEFVEDNLEKSDGSNLKIGETYSAFRIWYRENFDGKCPSQRDFKDGVMRKMGKCKPGRGGGWHGWRFIPQVEDDDDMEELETTDLVEKATFLVEKELKKDSDIVLKNVESKINSKLAKVPIKPIKPVKKI